MLLIKKSNSSFLYEQLRVSIDAINQHSGEVKVAKAIEIFFDAEPQQPCTAQKMKFFIKNLI